MKIIKGDLIDLALNKKFDVIVHGCNCFCNMGAGIARGIKKEFPEAYYVDCQTKKGDLGKLGTYSSINIEKNGHKITIVNAYTQYTYGSGLQVKYKELRNVFKLIKQDFSGKRIGYPKIGAGLAGGDWNIISKIIDEELVNEDHTFVEYYKDKEYEEKLKYKIAETNINN